MPTPPIWPQRQAAEQALRRAEAALERAPADPAARFARARLLDRLGRTEAAREAYLAVLAVDFGHAGALAGLGTLLAAGGFRSAARTVFAQAVAAHPDDPAAPIRLADLLREAEPDAARPLYEAALRLDPACAEAHQGLSYLLDETDPVAADRHRALGFGLRALTTAPYRGTAPPVTVLQTVSSRGGNIPTGRILDDRIFLTHTLVADHADPALALPPHDVALNAIGDADRCAPALDAAVSLLAHSNARILNPPDRVRRTGRAENHARLGALPGVIAPRTALLPRAAFADGLPAGFSYPVLLRSPGFHTGRHFRRVDSAADLGTAVGALPGETLMAIEYLDATGSDGAARKYRAMLIGGAILPLHLAISADWKVHYFTAGMTDPAHRAEERRYLDDMAGVLGPVALSALAAIGDALGLDYAGVDFALAPDGRLMLFEANATMALVPPPEGDHRGAAHAAALAAAQALIAAAPSRSPGPSISPHHA